jgi:hypothetical protein
MLGHISIDKRDGAADEFAFDLIKQEPQEDSEVAFVVRERSNLFGQLVKGNSHMRALSERTRRLFRLSNG